MVNTFEATMKTTKRMTLAERIRQGGYRVAVEIHRSELGPLILFAEELEYYYITFFRLIETLIRTHGRNKVSYYQDHFSGRFVIRILK
jgi:hypothetical protein